MPTVESDVLVVGGSIAGNFLASLIAKPGRSVHVIEAHAVVGRPVECAGIVSSKILTIMPVPRRAIVNRIRAARVVVPHRGSALIMTREAPVVLDREVLDAHFHVLAERRGVTYHLGERAMRIMVERERVVVQTTKRVFHARLVVGCDGAHSMVARSQGISNAYMTGKQATVNALPVDLPAFPSPNTCELSFHPAWHDFFGWVVPAGGTTFRVGIVATRGVAKAFASFLASRFGTAASRVAHGAIMTGGTVPIGLPKPCAFHRVLLLGDAACHVKASTGGGLVMLGLAARVAAGAIDRAFNSDNFTRSFFTKHYQRPCMRRIGMTLKVHYIVHLALQALTREDLAALIEMATHPRVRHALQRVADMDFPLPFLVRMLSVRSFYTWLARFARRNAWLVLAAIDALVRSGERAPSKPST